MKSRAPQEWLQEAHDAHWRGGRLERNLKIQISAPLLPWHYCPYLSPPYDGTDNDSGYGAEVFGIGTPSLVSPISHAIPSPPALPRTRPPVSFTHASFSHQKCLAQLTSRRHP